MTRGASMSEGEIDPAPADLPRAVAEPHGGDIVRRHSLITRLWHWTNLVAVTVMLMSGLMIFNAHPRLYWGQYGSNAPGHPDPAWLDLSGVNGGVPFPPWITIPSHYSLADARLWHFAFAWILGVAIAAYLIWSLFSGHLKRDLAPGPAELAPANIWHDIKDHARLRFPTGLAALKYNVLQKLAKVRGVSFEWNDVSASPGRSPGRREIGVIAQEVEAVFPELVTTWGEAQACAGGRAARTRSRLRRQCRTSMCA